MTVGEGTTGGHTVLRFAVLGPVHAWQGDRPLPSGSPQQRALLAAVLLRRGRTATVDELISALWGEDPPPQALPVLRTYASRMRRALAPRNDVLVTEPGGYALRLGPPDELDLDTVTELAARAERAAAAGRPAAAHVLYGEALELWEGEALGGVPGPEADSQRDRLAEQRLALREQRLEAGLEAGLHAESVSELTALTTHYPLQERLRELLMLALYRSGRQAEALAVYADARRLLIEELGVEPRAELSELHQRILTADASLNLAGPAAGQAAPAVRPAQLPAAVPDFTGRASFVAELGAQLATAGGRVMAVSAVAGIGGVGKTTLAVQVAHAAREHFPDGQLYVDLQGAGPAPADPGAVLGAFLRALGTPDDSIPDGLAERAALYRSLLDGRRVLALLDNARDAAQVRHLLPGTPGCATLITSRVRMVDLAGAHLVDLDVMSPEEALTLFTRIVGADRVGAERQAAMDVVAACGFLPLAIRIAASRLAARRTWTVAALARKLSDERRRLDELQAGDQAVKATFELGYGQLEPEQARTFRLLGLTEGPDISVAAAAALLDRDPEDTEDLLESLVDTSLLESAAPGRYRLHDLVRLFARACAERDEQPPSERESARSRLLDHYLATATAVYRMQRPGDRVADHLERAAYPGLEFADSAAALEWLFAEAACLLACVRASRVSGQHFLRRAVDTLYATEDLAESGAYSIQHEQVVNILLDAAQQAEDERAQGRLHGLMSRHHVVAGRFDQADVEAQRSLLLATAAEDPLATGEALNGRGIVAIYQSRFRDAEAYLNHAVDAYREDGNRPGEASALCNLARVHVALGRLDSGVNLAREGIAIYDAAGLAMRRANGRYTLGVVLNQAGRTAEALGELNQAMADFRSNRQRLWEGVTHFRIAEVHHADGRPAEAAAHAEQALALKGIGGEWRRGTVLLILGRALRDLGQTDRARACWKDALTIFEKLDSPEAPEARNLLSAVGV
ncbi:BTAD domain-containing putative transcriptional regulator [Streptomyces sp. DSM 44917]|uniref:BTAD domain-containing putative transcriptional regulator n=1 Tax=Streptomyces boetiae TaxID=3075541 RepID=A0ABU2L1D6_9ACTN|nr:BTAD domain-containing putative transcriptional regulator [Streptomyces sp. DSM 44917]MDT0305350.1 BTAD domain-containing putative transcriptional regulator [Streptomyces sp. DSM 44917]